MKYNELIDIHHNRILKLRAIERMLDTETFRELYFSSHHVEKEMVLAYIRGYDIDNLRDWIKLHRNLDPAIMGMVALRKRAKKLEIPLWSRMTRLELIKALQHDKTTNDRDDSITDSGDDTATDIDESGSQ